jgi:fructose-1,6-bisphosphatase I
MTQHITTLDEFILRRQKDFPYASGELSGLLRDIGVAAKIVNREVNRAGLVNILGFAGSLNSSGEEVKKLDKYANERFIECLTHSGECAGIASEENESFEAFSKNDHKESNYVVVFDPLDGSSNIDVNASLGTIFGIYRRISQEGLCTIDDFLQAGNKQVAAGYIVYGTSTIMVYTTGRGVNGFTLDPSIGEFCLSHQNIKIPSSGKFYSINQGYYKKYSQPIQKYIDECAAKFMRLRYIGTMVADVHRTLLAGGIFLYPSLEGYPNGKLRLLYECSPMAFLIEQAGGIAINENMERIMDIQPAELHERASVILGSPEMVNQVADYLKAVHV